MTRAATALVDMYTPRPLVVVADPPAPVVAPVTVLPVPVAVPLVERDWVTEMRELINAHTGSDLPAPMVARKIVEELLGRDPELLHNWLLAGAVGFIREAISARDKSQRGRNRSLAGRNPEVRAAFRQGTEGEDPDEIRRLGDALHEKVVTDFLAERYVVSGHGDRMSLGEMGQAERLFVADGYQVTAKEHALREAFLRAIDKKAGPRKTSEVFTESTLAKLWHSLNGMNR